MSVKRPIVLVLLFFLSILSPGLLAQSQALSLDIWGGLQSEAELSYERRVAAGETLSLSLLHHQLDTTKITGSLTGVGLGYRFYQGPVFKQHFYGFGLIFRAYGIRLGYINIKLFFRTR